MVRLPPPPPLIWFYGNDLPFSRSAVSNMSPNLRTGLAGSRSRNAASIAAGLRCMYRCVVVPQPMDAATIKAVQTLSRLNRAHRQKHDVCVLDFMNDTDTIQAAFADYYRTTILSEETDPNKLHDLKAALRRI